MNITIEIEKALVCWVRSLLSEGIPGSNTLVQSRALVLANENSISYDVFKASYMWLKVLRGNLDYQNRV
jgi:hypothetical protein